MVKAERARVEAAGGLAVVTFGGDGYTVLQSAVVVIDSASGDTMANHLIDFAREAGTVAPVIEGRIVRED